MISLSGPTEPHLYDDLDPERLGRDVFPRVKEYTTIVNDRTVNWCVAPCPTQKWATLVYPEDADFAAGKLSVLSPVGAALIGLSVGQSIEKAEGRKFVVNVMETNSSVDNIRRLKRGEIEFGLGLHIGTVTHANVGSPNRLAFNVVGPAVNKTARLQAMTKEAGVPLLLSKELAPHIRRPIRSVGHFDLRGVNGPQEMFTLGQEL